MKLEITRALAVAAGIAVMAGAMMTWSEPSPAVLSAQNSLGYCPMPVHGRAQTPVHPDQDLLLFIFGMSQSLGRQG